MYCFRHIIANFISTFKNHNINGRLCHAAIVANRGSFNEAMTSIRSENANAADWMMSEPVERWARHGFDPNIKSDHIINNMEMLDTNEKEARKLQVIHGRGEWHETVDKYGKKFLVSVVDVTCDFSMWQISGLPCMHAIVVFMYRREFAQDYVH
ncbi:hypothetical protein QYF36_003745 [Acer negundo]|nr:hypothetical protein QYF36_003745 [Acer negundo]